MSSYVKTILKVFMAGNNLSEFVNFKKLYKQKKLKVNMGQILPTKVEGNLDAKYTFDIKINPPLKSLILDSCKFPSLIFKMFFDNQEREFVGYCKIEKGIAVVSYIYNFKSKTIKFKVVKRKITPPITSIPKM